MREERERPVVCVRSKKSSQLYTDNWYLRPSRSPSHSGSEPHRHSPVEVVSTVSPARPPYERQISRVRSLSVFSSHSHIHPDTQNHHRDEDNISLDFDILEEEVRRDGAGSALTVDTFQRRDKARRT